MTPSQRMNERICAIQQQLQHTPIVTLVAVSKKQSVADIQSAYAAGITQFGENYVQEAQAKIHACRQAQLAITWHYIGRIQSNKCQLLAQCFDWIQTLDRADVACKLDTHARMQHKPLNVCIQVNISRDANKSGIAPQLDVLCALADEIHTCSGLRLRGIMVMPKKDDAEAFARAQQLFADFKTTRQGHACDSFSMGMTHDYKKAIAQGSTMVRIGSGIFGERD